MVTICIKNVSSSLVMKIW